MVRAEVDDKEKRDAIEAVLTSESFARADQLRSFLRFVCELEISNRGNEITEYSIGVKALGRPEDFSPNEDSSVRARAKALRQKLHDLYESELSDQLIHIDLPKGSYRPRFLLLARNVAVKPNFQSTPGYTRVEPQRPPVAGNWKWMLAGILIGALLMAAITLIVRRSSDPIDPIIREAWGPLAKPDANVLVCIGSELFMVFHTYPYSLPPDVKRYPAPAESADWWRESRPLPPDTAMTMHHIRSVMHIGAASAAATAATTLGTMGVAYQMLPERSVPTPAMARRNVMMIGNPEFSNAVTTFLEQTPLVLEFDVPTRNLVIRDRRSRRTWAPAFYENGYFKEVYGLVTVLPSADGQKRTVVFSGITSVGSQGAMEFFTSPAHLKDLKERFRQQGHSKFPSRWQVVVKCKVSDTQLVSYDFDTEVVPPASE